MKFITDPPLREENGLNPVLYNINESKHQSFDFHVCIWNYHDNERRHLPIPHDLGYEISETDIDEYHLDNSQYSFDKKFFQFCLKSSFSTSILDTHLCLSHYMKCNICDFI